MEKLSKRQEAILASIKKHIAKHGYPPTIREICKYVGLKSPATAHFHLDVLSKAKYIKRSRQKNRSIELLVQNEYAQDKGTINIPMLGYIPAGNPIEAIEQAEEFFPLPSNMISTKKQVFALTVHGNSMINKGIFNEDIVIVEQSNTANNGDVVAAMTDENEVTLKTFYKEKDHFRLQPENDTMDPIILDNVTVIGKAVGLYRKI